MEFPTTKFLFLENDKQLTGSATVLGVVDWPAGGHAVVLDQTYFYPQGGGQPADWGRIESAVGCFGVKDVRKDSGVIYHIGEFSRDSFGVDEVVQLLVESERRLLNSRLHSAGHLLDVALETVGYALEPTKGFHFPNGAYVEYAGDIPLEKRDEVRAAAEAEANRLIQIGGEVKIQSIPLDQVKNFSHFVPEYLSPEEPVRMVTVSGQWGCPCGGTHVKNISELGRMTVTKIKNKDGKLRVSYDVSR